MKEEIENLNNKAQEMLDSGQVQKALEIYQKIVRIDPDNNEAWLMLAAINGETGAVVEAIECCRHALDIKKDDAEAVVVMGRLLLHQGNMEEAAIYFQNSVELDPDDSESWQILAGIYGQGNRFEEAAQCSREVIRLAPEHAAGYISLCQALISVKDYPEALDACQNAARLDPENIAVWIMLGQLFENKEDLTAAEQAYRQLLTLEATHSGALEGLARMLKYQGDLGGAKTAYRSALKSSPNSTSILVGLGQILANQEQLLEAETYFRKALKYESGCADAWVGLGNVLQDQGSYDEAMPCYEEALSLDKECADAYYNKAVLSQRLGRADLALEDFDQAIRVRPDYWRAHWDKSFLLLMKGDFVQGWQEYEWRLSQDEHVERLFEQPVWDGSALGGKTILVLDEQGYGDTFQFIRYLSLLKRLGARVVFECRRGLYELLKSCEGYDELLPFISPQHIPGVAFDVYVHLMSLPGIFGTTLDDVPSAIPYLKPAPGREERWIKYLADDDNFKVGIAWASGPRHTNEMSRSCLLEDFSVLGQVPGVSFYSLQKGPGEEQADTPPKAFNLIRIDKQMDLEAPFVDTAAVMKALDLIITIDTSTAHLAGALGCQVWVLLCATPDWRWMQDREDSPWYPGMRLFRQTEPGNWQGVFQRIAKVLEAVSAGSKQG